MMNNPSPATRRKRKQGKSFLGNLWYAVSFNWPWKVGCLIIALLMWAALVSQDATLTREKVFSNVEVNFVNETTLRRNGFVVIEGMEDPLFVTARAMVPQLNYDSAAASNFNIRVDLSAIRETGNITVPVIASSNSTYGTVSEVSPSEVTLTVERYISRNRIPVTCRTTGTAPEGLYAGGEARTDPSFVTVAGPYSVVSRISHCEALLDLGTLEEREGTQRIAVPFTLYTTDREPVTATGITVYANDVEVDSITVEQTLYLLIGQEISDEGVVRGTPAEGFEIKSVSLSPNSVMTAVGATEEVYGDMAYLNGYVDVTGLQETLVTVLPLNKPSYAVHLSTEMVYVTVQIGPVESE